MPSKDTYHEKHPEANASLEKGDVVSSDPVRPRATTRSMSGTVQRLARRLERDPDELAKKIPADTVRRTKFPVTEQVNEDGTRTFKHPPGIIDGPRALVQK